MTSLRISFKQALCVARPQTALQSAGFYVSLARRRRFNHISPRLASTTSNLADAELEKYSELYRSDPVRLFNTQLEGGILKKKLALSHLKALTERTRYDTGLGEATLKWMWDQHDKYDPKEDKKLLEQTIRHLVREGKEELAWDWIEQESRKPDDSSDPKARYVWKSATVCALVSAKAFSADYDSLDGALETFFRAKSSSYSIPVASARTIVATLLMMPREKMVMDSVDNKVDIEEPRWPKTSTELWENFFKSIDVELYNDQPLSVQLPLYHPQVLNAFPFLEHCRYLAGEKALVKSMVKEPSVIPWTRRGLHAEAVLRRQGHEEHAEWLGEFIRELHKKSKSIRDKQEKLRGAIIGNRYRRKLQKQWQARQ